MHAPKLLGLHANPTRGLRIILGLLPFILMIALYLWASDVRLAENPKDKLLPSPSQMLDNIQRLATEPDKRSGKILLWSDTLASLSRIAMGAGAAAFIGILIGLNMGMFKGFSVLFSPLVNFVSMIPPLAILPILFISFGIGELGKVMLIFIGCCPFIIRDMYLATLAIPRQQIVKALTLGASPLAIVYRVVLPQLMPRAIDSLRLTLGAAWLFLIAAEAIASTEGLGYRIFLVRRYMDMATILPYVAWVTLLGFSIDWLLRTLRLKLYPWYQSGDH